jgi:hypothetical protein
MSRRRQLRVKLRNSLHGQAIAIPRNVSKEAAAAILRQELQAVTAVDTGDLISDWSVNELSNGDMRVVNSKPYSRRVFLDGSSPQTPAGAHNEAIRKARSRITQEGLKRG